MRVYSDEPLVSYTSIQMRLGGLARRSTRSEKRFLEKNPMNSENYGG